MFFNVGLFDFELTHVILTRVKWNFRTVFGIKIFLPNRAQRPDKYSPTWNFMANPMVVSRCLGCVGFKIFVQKTTKKSEKIMKIQEYSKKNQHFCTLLNMFFHMTRSNIRCLSTEKTLKNPRNSAYLCLIIMV